MSETTSEKGRLDGAGVGKPREQKIREARELRAKGWTAPQIGQRLAVSESTVRNWYLGGDCADCGQPIDGGDGQWSSSRCRRCHRQRFAERNERIFEAWRHGEKGKTIALREGMAESAVLSLVQQHRERNGAELPLHTLPHSNAHERYRLIADRWNAGVHADAIVAEVGTTRPALYQMLIAMREQGYEAPPRGRRHDPEEIRRLWKSELSTDEVAAQLGLTVGSVYGLISRMRRRGFDVGSRSWR